MKVLKSAEDYLETILILQKKNGRVRSIDIANDREFSKPSISVAMKNLKQKELIHMDNDGIITLTIEGERIAADIYDRHCLIRDFLISLGVPTTIAEDDACKIEHDISKESIQALKRMVKNKKN